MSRPITRWVLLLLVVLALAVPAYGQNVLTIRVESLDALTEDIDTLAVAMGQEPGSGGHMLMMAQGALGLPNLDWFDRDAPLVVTLPLAGMMLGDKGFVGALPAADIDAAMNAIQEAVDGAKIDENGVLNVPVSETDTIFLMPRNGYLVFGRNPNLVGGFDPTGLLAGAGLPPGTMAAEFNVDSMRAMIGMGMEAVRQNMGAAISQGLEGENANVSPEAANRMTNEMIGWLETLIANTRSIQLSVEVTGGHVVMHNHYLPVSGSSLQTFLKAQKGGMPDLARALDPGDASMIMVGNMNWTDEARAGLKGFMDGYAQLLETSIASTGGMEELSGWVTSMMQQYAEVFDCMGGEVASVFDMSNGMSFSQLVGVRDSEQCGTIDKRMAAMVANLPEEFAELMEVAPTAMNHRGVNVSSIGMNPQKLLSVQGETEDTAELAAAQDMMTSIYGEDGLKVYTAVAGNVMISTAGPTGDDQAKALIDRVMDGKRGKGIDPAIFSPFSVGAGLYYMIDMGRFMNNFIDAMPHAGDAEAEQAQRLFEALGPMTGGLEFQHDALAVKFAMSTAGLAVIAEMAKEEAQEVQHELAEEGDE